MGLLTRPRAAIDWRTEPIVAEPNWQRHQTVRPSFVALAETLIAESGRDSRRIDTDKVVGALTNICRTIAAENLPDRSDAIEAILERPGNARDAIWDYFTYAGAKGVALSNHIGELLTSEKVRIIIASMIDEGRLNSTGDVGPDGIPLMSPDSPDTEALADPGGDELDPISTVYKLISSVGLSVMVYGPGDLSECFVATSEAAPLFSGTVTENGLLGAFPDMSNVYWFGIDGVDGSAIVVPVTPDANVGRILREVVDPLSNLGAPWSTAIARGSVVPTTFARIFDRSVVRRVWHLPGLHTLRPVDAEPLELSWSLRSRMMADEWKNISGNFFAKEVVDAQGARITVHFASWRGSHAVFVALGESIDGRVPDEMTRIELSSCEIGVAYEQVVLIERLQGPGCPSFADIGGATDRVVTQFGSLSGPVADPMPPRPADQHGEGRCAPQYDRGRSSVLELARGANCELDTHRLRVELDWKSGPAGATVDTSALLLADTGKVRSDSDFVFYNQPRHEACSVRHEKYSGTAGAHDYVSLDLATATPYAHTIVIVGSLDGGTFSSLHGLRAVVNDLDSGHTIISFPITGLTSETALILGEIYQRNGAWKFRAVGQGYATGLRGVAEDFGITVD